MPERIIITGATGFIGSALTERLLGLGYEVVALTRDASSSKKRMPAGTVLAEWDGRTSKGWASYAEGAFGIVNLAGENIGDKRWDAEKKRRILRSRVDAGAAVLDAVKNVKVRPRTVVQASAVGFYGSRGDDKLDETSSKGSGFLSDVCVEWEKATEGVERLGVRRVVIRSGVVLGRNGGALPKLMEPFKYYAGGYIGGDQWFSWIHLQDEVQAITHLLENEKADGVFDLTSPHPVKMRELCRVLGEILKKPCWLKVPQFVVETVFGDMAREMLLSSQRAYPKRLLDSGFKFKFADARAALNDILGDI